MQKHGTTPNTYNLKKKLSRESIALCMPGRLDRDNIEATRDIARICRRKKHQLPYGTRIEGRIASWDKQNNRTRRKPESTKRLPRGGLRDLVELVGGNLARGFGGDYGCGNARAPAGGVGRGGVEGSTCLPDG